MKKSNTSYLTLAAISLILVGILSTCTCPPGYQCPKPAEIVTPTQVIIRFNERADKSPNARDSIILKFQAKEEVEEVYKCMCGEDLILIQYQDDPLITPEDRVASAQGDVEHNTLGSMGDAFLNFEINLDQPQGTNVIVGDSIREDGNPNAVTVAVIDGGISREPEYQLDRYIRVNPGENGEDEDGNCLIGDFNGYDFTMEDGSSSEINIHGSRVSRLILNTVPTPYHVRLMDLRIFDKQGNSSLFYALCATQYAIDMGANIINMSWGYYAEEYPPLHLEYMQEAATKEITVVASAGNDSINTNCCKHLPSVFNRRSYDAPNVISVAALGGSPDNPSNALADYSNYGSKTVLLAAPGSHDLPMEGTSFEGTSYAAPIVTGAAVRYLINKPGSTSKQVVDCITSSISSTNPELKVITGGKLNLSLVNSCP